MIDFRNLRNSWRVSAKVSAKIKTEKFNKRLTPVMTVMTRTTYRNCFLPKTLILISVTMRRKLYRVM